MKTNPFDNEFFTDHDSWEKKQNRRFKIGAIVSGSITIVLLIACGITIRHSAIKSKAEKDKCQAMVGKLILINKDTLSVIDYSTWDKTYTLSNGVKVDYKIAEKNLLNP